MTITLSLDDQRASALQAKAEEFGLTNEQMAQFFLDDWFERTDEDFQKALGHVCLRKTKNCIVDWPDALSH